MDSSSERRQWVCDGPDELISSVLHHLRVRFSDKRIGQLDLGDWLLGRRDNLLAERLFAFYQDSADGDRFVVVNGEFAIKLKPWEDLERSITKLTAMTRRKDHDYHLLLATGTC